MRLLIAAILVFCGGLLQGATTYRFEIDVPSLPVSSGGPLTFDPFPAVTLRLDYTGDLFGVFDPAFKFNDPRITNVSPVSFAGYPIRLADSFLEVNDEHPVILQFEFGPPHPSSEGAYISFDLYPFHFVAPKTVASGVHIASTEPGNEQIVGTASCQNCAEIRLTALNADEVPEPGSGLLFLAGTLVLSLKMTVKTK